MWMWEAGVFDQTLIVPLGSLNLRAIRPLCLIEASVPVNMESGGRVWRTRPLNRVSGIINVAFDAADSVSIEHGAGVNKPIASSVELQDDGLCRTI